MRELNKFFVEKKPFFLEKNTPSFYIKRIMFSVDNMEMKNFDFVAAIPCAYMQDSSCDFSSFELGHIFLE